MKTDDLQPTLREHPIRAAAPLYLDGDDWTATHAGSGSFNGSINATVPGDIITDLQRAGKVPGPYFNCSWQEPAFMSAWNEGTWAYSKRFLSPAGPAGPAGQDALLVFDGVLMGAVVELNGRRLTRTIDGNVSGATDQFFRYAFIVGDLLQSAGKENSLTVSFGAGSPDAGGRFTFSDAIDWC